MITLWIAAALISAGAAALIVHRAMASARLAGGPDPALAVYRRQLVEIEELAERGLIAPDEQRAARAETGRRLLAAAETGAAPFSTRPGPRTLLAIAALAPLLALAVYMAIGSPSAPDQPFARRLQAWRTHPERYGPPELAAALRDVARQRPADPEPLRRLAALELSMGDADAAIHDLRKAIARAPDRVDLWGPLGEVMVLKDNGEVSPEAAEVFRKVLSLDPRSVVARYALARIRVTSGDVSGGVEAWRALLADMPPDDPRRRALESDIASAVATGRPAPAATSPAPSGEVAAAIRGMVEGLAARLSRRPDDPDGWVRLVRAYTVLGEATKRDAALAEARKRYAGDPDVLRRLDAALKAPQ